MENRPKNRDEAVAARLNRYFTGKPCKNGHLDWRYVSGGACLGCISAKRNRYSRGARNAAILNGGLQPVQFLVHPDDVPTVQAYIDLLNAPRLAEYERRTAEAIAQTRKAVTESKYPEPVRKP